MKIIRAETQKNYRVGNSYKGSSARKASNPDGYERRKNQYLNKASDAHYKNNYPKDNYSDMKVGSSNKYKKNKRPHNRPVGPVYDDYYDYYDYYPDLYYDDYYYYNYPSYADLLY